VQPEDITVLDFVDKNGELLLVGLQLMVLCGDGLVEGSQETADLFLGKRKSGNPYLCI
jgi:hypothetical protein